MSFNNLKKALDTIVNDMKTPGVDCIVYKEHEILFRYFAGKRNIEKNIDIDGNELYIIFSMTKMLTCATALTLFEEGKFRMDDTVSMYIKEFEKMKLTDMDSSDDVAVQTGKDFGGSGEATEIGYAKTPILVKDLFTMGAGLDYDLFMPSIKRANEEGRTSTLDIAKAIAEKPLGFEPGTRFRYSLCHDVLGALIEIWSGMKFGEYMKKAIFEPLGMKDTFFGLPSDEARISRMPPRYTKNENGEIEVLPFVCPYILSPEHESGGAGLVSSTEDYTLFLDALANGGMGKSGKRILLPETIELMRTNHLNERQQEDFYPYRPGYGYGLGCRTHINPEMSGSKSPIGEFGWDGAAGAFSMVDTENKLSLTYFQQMHGWDMGIQHMLRNALYEDLEG